MTYRVPLYFFSLLLAFAVRGQNSGPGPIPVARSLGGHTLPAWRKLTPSGAVPATNELRLALSLPLRNTGELNQLLMELYDPASPNFHRYLTPEEFTARFGPTPAEYQAIESFALTNGLRITDRHPNRLILDVAAPVSKIENAFHIKLNNYRHPHQGREFFAPDTEPTVSAQIPLLQVSGLNNYAIPQPNFRRDADLISAKVVPRAGTGPSSTYVAKDLLNAYLPGMTNLTGTGQSVGLLQFDGYYTNDIKSYTNTCGIKTSAKLVNIAVDGGVSTPGTGNGEVALDIEMVLALAPGVSNIYVYEAPNPSPWVDLLSKMANDNKAKQLSCSWGDNSPSTPDFASEQIFQQMALQGQSFFNASGDSDAFTNGIPFPSESTNVTQVGATTLTTGSGAIYSSEQVWNWGITRGASYDGVGSSGGISVNFALPYYQQGMTANLNAAAGSLTRRNVPDVSFIGDNVYSVSDNGASSGATAGTSCAAPLWAAFMALVNQQNAANGQSPAGFINPAVYAIGKGANYNACFHDTVISSNTWVSSPTKFRAVTGFDLCTGWGTPNGTNLINALAPAPTGPPQILASPVSQTNSLGATVVLQVSAIGTAPLAYQWYFTNAIPDATNASYIINNLAVTNAGNYFVVITNSLGSVTSAVATLTVTLAPTVLGFAPAFGATNDTVSINGLLFTNVTAVSFNGTPANFTVNTATNLTATVPVGAGTGPIMVTTTYGNGSSSSNFTVLAGNGSPVISSFTPGTGVTNSFVILTGTNFVNVSGVSFNGLNANFTVDSISQISAQVPVGATDGFIAVANIYGVGLSATAFIIATNPVSPVSISQIFGGGGLTGAPYQNDYVELYNRSGSPVSLASWSLQYASSAGTSWSKLNLSGSIQPGRYYLIRLAGGTTGSALPTPDATGTIDISSTKGKLALMSVQTTIASGTSSPIGTTGLEDFVGYGSANAYEGTGAAPTISAITADFRAGNGAQDTGNNAADFSTGTPNPRNSSYGGVVTQPPTVTTSAASGINTNAATLNGSFNPNNLPATAQFEYGLTTSYGTVVALSGTFAGSNNIIVATNITGLSAATTYHFRLTATNSAGLTVGADQSFTTASGGSGGGGTGGTNFTGVIAAWEVNGLSGYGPSPFAPASNAPNIQVVGLTRGSGVGAGSGAGANAWGGTGFVFADQTAAIAGNSFVTFGFTVTNGGSLSLTNIAPHNIRHSSSGSTTGIWQYAVGNAAFVNIGSAITWGSTTTATGNPQVAIDLSGIAALQNIPPGTNVIFRIVLWGGSAPGSGTWYFNNIAAGSDLILSGTISYPVVVTGTPLQLWRQQWFGTTNNSGTAADTYVASSDGMPNLLKYALGLNPLQPATNPVTGKISDGFLRLTVPRNATATDITYLIESAGDVGGGWNTNAVIVDTNTPALLSGHDTNVISNTSRRFIRLHITNP